MFFFFKSELKKVITHDSCMYGIGLDTTNCRSKVTFSVKLGGLNLLVEWV